MLQQISWFFETTKEQNLIIIKEECRRDSYLLAVDADELEWTEPQYISGGLKVARNVTLWAFIWRQFCLILLLTPPRSRKYLPNALVHDGLLTRGCLHITACLRLGCKHSWLKRHNTSRSPHFSPAQEKGSSKSWRNSLPNERCSIPTLRWGYDNLR